MATYGFLDVLEEELEKNFPFDFEISWDKRNHAVEVSFLLEAQNAAGVEMVDEDGEVSSDDILFEEAVLFYNPAKSTVNAEDYLTAIPYLPKKGFSREFLAYFALFLKDTAEVGLDALMDFLEDPETEEFVMEWNQEVFEEGKVGLEEGHCNSFTGKLDTEDELYDEITIRTDKYPYVGFNESEIASIELTQDGITK